MLNNGLDSVRKLIAVNLIHNIGIILGVPGDYNIVKNNICQILKCDSLSILLYGRYTILVARRYANIVKCFFSQYRCYIVYTILARELLMYLGVILSSQYWNTYCDPSIGSIMKCEYWHLVMTPILV